jgi:hypothetical protein
MLGTLKNFCRGYSYALLVACVAALACGTLGRCADDEKTIPPDVASVGSLDDGIYVFTAEGCIPCERIKVETEILKKRGHNVVYLDSTVYAKLFANVGGKATPLTLVVEDGKIKRKIRGYRPWYVIAPPLVSRGTREVSYDASPQISYGFRAGPG